MHSQFFKLHAKKKEKKEKKTSNGIRIKTGGKQFRIFMLVLCCNIEVKYSFLAPLKKFEFAQGYRVAAAILSCIIDNKAGYTAA